MVWIALSACGSVTGGQAGDAGHGSDADPGGDAGPAPASGTLLLAKTFGGAGQDAPGAIAVDASGNILLTGVFYSPDLDFGCAQHAISQQPVGSVNRDAFIVKLDATGACKWVVALTGAQDELITGVSVAANGTVFVAGLTSSSAAAFGNFVFPSNAVNVYKGFFARLNAVTGNVEYVRRWGGASSAGIGSAVSVCASGKVVVGGGWSKATVSEAIAVPGASSSLALTAPAVVQQFGFIAVYDQNGEPQWGRIIKTGGSDGPVSVFQAACDANDDILVAGVFSSAIGLEPIGGTGVSTPVRPELAPAGEEVFYLKMTGSGALGSPVWTKAWASEVTDIEPSSIAVGASGTNAITFSTFESQDFGAGSQRFAGGTDIAIGGYQAGGGYLFGTMYGGPGSDNANGVALAASGDRFFTGSSTGSLNLGGGELASFGGGDLIVASFDPSGRYRWAVAYGSSSGDGGTSVALGPSGLVVAGAIGGTLDVGSHHFTPAGSDILLLIFQP